MITALVAAVVFIPLVSEARRAASNEALQRRHGGVEAEGDVYAIMRVAYPAAFLSMIAEGAVRDHGLGLVSLIGFILFAAAKILKWWAISSLGTFWTFRVIVVPGAPLVTGGPYRFLRHPNYVAVAGELIAIALMTGARLTGPVAVVGFCLLMLKRISVEERALRRL